MTERALDGTFIKGKSGNPGGLSSDIRKKISELKQQALEACPAALRKLSYHIDDESPVILNKTDLGVIKELLDRGMGKPAQQINIESEQNSESPLEMSRQEIVERLAYLEQALKNK